MLEPWPREVPPEGPCSAADPAPAPCRGRPETPSPLPLSPSSPDPGPREGRRLCLVVWWPCAVTGGRSREAGRLPAGRGHHASRGPASAQARGRGRGLGPGSARPRGARRGASGLSGGQRRPGRRPAAAGAPRGGAGATRRAHVPGPRPRRRSSWWCSSGRSTWCGSGRPAAAASTWASGAGCASPGSPSPSSVSRVRARGGPRPAVSGPGGHPPREGRAWRGTRREHHRRTPGPAGRRPRPPARELWSSPCSAARRTGFRPSQYSVAALSGPRAGVGRRIGGLCTRLGPRARPLPGALSGPTARPLPPSQLPGRSPRRCCLPRPHRGRGLHGGSLRGLQGAGVCHLGHQVRPAAAPPLRAQSLGAAWLGAGSGPKPS